MKKEPKKDKYFTLMIVPHDAQGRSISLKIPVSWIYVSVSLLVFFLLFVGSSFVYSTMMSRKLVNYKDALSKNREQLELIRSFSVKNRQVTQAINDLVNRDNELRKQLGLKGWQNKIKLATKEVKSSLDFELVSASLNERRASLEELKNWVNLVRSRFAVTPSTWPIYGRIVSFIGYRSYPWRGFHAGIDIQAQWGAPARATADGVVSYIGWHHGYGKTVEIDHGYGVKTVYAHNSGYAVNVGQKVRRGQIICYVGTTGWTTGPHLHYEVRRWGQPLNPVAYLDLNILTASRLWR